MKRLIEEAFTVDNAGHLVLWVIIFIIIYFLPAYISAPLVATLWLANREKLQWNAHIGTRNFMRGWPWQDPTWSFHKHMEWIAPSVGGLVCALLVFQLI